MKILFAFMFMLGMSAVAAPALAQTSIPAVQPAPAIAGVATPSTASPLAPPTFAPPPVVPTGDGALAASAEAPAMPDFMSAQAKLRIADAAPSPDESVFFTPWQHALLEEAKRGYATRSANGTQTDASKTTVLREISLGGILYRAPRDWTIYLNNRRVTPATLPEEVLDIRVSDNDIHLKWFDSQTNLIFPIVLRANQRFNLDARIFLPGVSASAPAATP